MTTKGIFQVLQEAITKKKRHGLSKTAQDIMTMNAEYVNSNQTVEEARKLIIKNDFSQLPVIDNGIVKGSITDRLLVRLGESGRVSRIRRSEERRVGRECRCGWGRGR